MASIRQLVLVAGAVIWLTVVALITHIPLGPESVSANGDAIEDWSDDKTFHMFAYGTLAALVTAVPLVRIREDNRPATDADATLIGVIAAGLTVLASLDEFTQPWCGRSMTVSDWIADLIGIAVGQGIALGLCLGLRRSTEYSLIGETGSLVTAFIGEDEESAEGYVAAQPGESWLHLTSMNYSGDSIIAGLDGELQRANLKRDETDAQRDFEVADGQSPLGDRGHDQVARDTRGLGASGAREGESSTVGRGAPGSGGQLLPAGSSTESDEVAGGLERDLLVWDDARR